MAINFAATLDNRNILAAVREAQQAMHKLSEAVDGVGDTVDDATDSIKQMITQAAALGGISLGMAGVKEFLSQMISVRKEMQGFQISLDTLLGDKDKASAMFSELRDFAATTPLMLSSLANGAQTMLGFDIAAERVVPTLKQIGDISMGDANKFNSLVLSFSQMSATGKLMGQDLLQMINAGFNPLTEISRKTGKSISELKDEMSAGAISSEMVAEAFATATSEGGKFYDMLNKQGAGLSGQINTLNGALSDMYNSLAESSEGAISTAIGGITTLIQNYDKIGKIIATLIATYGAYKAALIATNVAQMANAAGWGMTLLSIKETIVATKAATAAQTLYNLAVKANPYVLAATAIVAVAGALWTFASNSEKATLAQKNLNKELDDFVAKQKSQRQEIEHLIDVIRDEASTYSQKAIAYDTLKVKCQQLTDKYSLEQLAVVNLTEAYGKLNEIQDEAAMSVKLENFNRMVRVYNELRRIINDRHNGKSSRLNGEATAYINANGLVGNKTEDIAAKLKKEIDSQRAELESYKKSKEKKDEKTYKQEAQAAYDDWKKAKAEYEKIIKSQTATAKQVQEARSKMEAADTIYEKLTGSKASKVGADTQKKQTDAIKSAKELRDLQEKQAKDDQRAARDRELETEQARINAMQEGTNKVLAQIDIDYKREREAIKREEEDLRDLRENNARQLWEAQNKKLVDQNADAWKSSGAQATWRNNYTLSEEDIKYFQAKTQAAETALETKTAEQTKKDQEAMDEFLIRYGSYFQQREAIQRKYNRQIQEAETEGAKMLLQSEMAQSLEEIDRKFEKSGSKLYKMWKDVAKKSRKELKSIISQLKQVQKAMKDGEISDSETSILKNIGFTDEDIEKLKSGQLTIDDIRSHIDDLSKQLDESSSAAQNFWDALNNQDGAIDIEKVASSFQNMLSQINAYSQGLNKMASLLSNGTVKDAMEDVQTLVDEIGTGASIGASAGGGWGALIGAIIGTVSGVGNIIKDHINDDQIKTIKNLQRNIDQLERSYSKLGDAVQETYSKEKQSNIELQIANLNQQNILISRQIYTEKQKKDASEETIDSYQEAISNNLVKIAELKKQAKDAIFGSDLQSAIESFADAYADAWTNNENRTRKAKDVVRDIMKKMVNESIKSSIEASSAMEKIREKLTEYFKDGILSEAEQQAIYSEAERLQQQLDKQFSWADDLFDSTQDFSSSTSGGFQTMSQESADELNGRFTTAQISIEGILQQTMLIYANGQQQLTIATDSNDVLKDIKNLMITMGSHIEDIATYSRALTTFGDKFDQMNRQLAKL